MCVIEVHCDIYPNSTERRRPQLFPCEHGTEDEPCKDVWTYKHKARLVAYSEAPPIMDARHDRSLVPPPPLSVIGSTLGSNRSETSSNGKGGRRYWKKGDKVVIDVNLNPFKSKDKAKRTSIGLHDEHKNHRSLRHSKIPIPPHAPAPPKTGVKHPNLPDGIEFIDSDYEEDSDRYDDDDDGARHGPPPPPYLDRRTIRRQKSNEKIRVIQVAPKSTRRHHLGAQDESPRDSSSSPQESTLGDRILRDQLDNRNKRRTPRQAENTRGQSPERRRPRDGRPSERPSGSQVPIPSRRQASDADLENLPSPREHRRVTSDQERLQAIQRNKEIAEAQRARDRELYARYHGQRDDDTVTVTAEPVSRRTAAAEALRGGQRVFRRLDSDPVFVHDDRESDRGSSHTDQSDASWTSAPNDIRILSPRGSSMREHGERVLDARRRSYQQSRTQETRHANDEDDSSSHGRRERRKREKGSSRHARNDSGVVWDDGSDGSRWR